MKKKRIAILFGVGGVSVLLAAAVLLYRGLTAPEYLSPRIEQQLSRALRASVQIEGFAFGLFGRTDVKRIHIWPDAEAKKASEAPTVVLKDIMIAHDPLSLLRGRFVPEKVLVGNVDIRIVPEALQWLAAIETNHQKQAGVPDIEVADGTLSFLVPELTHPLKLHNFRLSAWHDAGGRQVIGVSEFAFGGNPIKLRFEAMPQEGGIETWVSVRGFHISDLPVAGGKKLGLDPAKLKLEGDLSGNIAFFAPSEAGVLPRIAGQFSVSGFSLRHPEFAAGLENGAASFRITENAILMDSGRAELLGGSIDISSAGVRFRERGVESAWIRAAASALQAPLITETGLLSQLPEAFRPAVVSGFIGGEGHLQWRPAEGLTHGGSLEIKNAAGSVSGLDSQFSDLDARVILDASGRLRISRAEARLFGGRVAAGGSFEIAGGKVYRHDLELRLNEVSEPDELVNRLPEPVQAVIAKAGLKVPVVNGVIAFQSGKTRLDLAIDAESAAIERLPVRMEDLRMELSWTSGSGRVVIENARAKVGDSPLQANGALTLGPPVCLNFILVGRHLDLNNQILEWLGLDMADWEARGSCDIELRARKWRPSGNSPAAMLENLKVLLDLRDAALSHPETGIIIEHVSSHITMDQDGVFLSGMVGNFCGISFRGGGWLPLGKSDRNLSLHAVSEDISLDEALYADLPFDIGLKSLGLRGQCALKVDLQGNGTSLEGASANIRMLIHHLELSPEGKKITASGSARLRVTAENWPEPEIRGSVNLDRLSYGHFNADRLSSDFTYGNRRLSIAEMTLSAYGGKVRITQTDIDIADGTWDGKAAAVHLDLESLVSAFDMAGSRTPSGIMHGEVRLAGRGRDPGALSGEGSVKVSGGRLYNFPLLLAVLNVLDLQFPRQSPVTDAYGEFRISNGQLNITDLLFSGGTFPAHFQGSVTLDAEGSLKSNAIDLIVTVARKEGVLDQIPLINWAKHYTLDYLRRLVFQARVTGTVGDYKVNTLSSPVTDPIRKMFSLLKKITPSPPAGN